MKRRLALALLILVSGVAIWLATRRPEQVHQDIAISENSPVQAEKPETAAPTTETDPLSTTPDASSHELPSAVLPRPKTVSLAAVEELPPQFEGTEGSSTIAPVTALENMRTMVRQYTLRFGENPVGSNPEITATLNGQNSQHVVFLQSDDGSHVNERGELVDTWGTPYFFHQLSSTEMEIHSAGPDHRMWTSDDLVIK